MAKIYLQGREEKMKKDISKIKIRRARLQKKIDRLWFQIKSMPDGPERDKKLKEYLASDDKKGILPTLESLEEFLSANPPRV